MPARWRGQGDAPGPKAEPRAQIRRAKGVEPSLIAGILGHRDGRMVERVYGRIEPAELVAVIGKRLDADRYKTGTSRRGKATKKRASSKKKAAA